MSQANHHLPLFKRGKEVTPTLLRSRSIHGRSSILQMIGRSWIGKSLRALSWNESHPWTRLPSLPHPPNSLHLRPVQLEGEVLGEIAVRANQMVVYPPSCRSVNEGVGAEIEMVPVPIERARQLVIVMVGPTSSLFFSFLLTFFPFLSSSSYRPGEVRP